MLPLLRPDPGSTDPLLLLLAALLIDAVIGDPAWLYGCLPHPVALIGQMIAALERRLNLAERNDRVRRALGILTVVLVVGLAAGLGALAAEAPLGWLVTPAVVAVLVAQRSLWDHVAAAAVALERSGVDAGRGAVSRIVGRDPQSLDEAAVARAAIESLAENFSDGVVAPVFWFVLLGLPGICAYKAVNTLDSMIGHRSERYRAFGWGAARLDDLANLLPARLATALLAIAAVFLPGMAGGDAVRAAFRDARHHRSPNAGWPESAMAGALGLALAGPRRYGGEIVADAWMGEGRQEASATDIRRALRLYGAACMVQAVVIAVALVVRRC
ncbi:MAG TPA: adenosylcobinamide-phosphate synthase CbiB [Stellaceae bacterium]|nr:adenosylcobinamide-phosphate synthase CbiB [Stellaceae bacterium]